VPYGEIQIRYELTYGWVFVYIPNIETFQTKGDIFVYQITQGTNTINDPNASGDLTIINFSSGTTTSSIVPIIATIVSGNITTQSPITTSPVAATTLPPSTMAPTTLPPSTMAPTTLPTSTMAPTTTSSLGLEILFNQQINITPEQVRTYLLSQSSNFIDIINTSEITLNQNSIKLMYSSSEITLEQMNNWREYINNLNDNKVQLTLDLFGLTELGNLRIIYLSTIINNKQEIKCNRIGCSDTSKLIDTECTFPEYYCYFENQVLVKDCTL